MRETLTSVTWCFAFRVQEFWLARSWFRTPVADSSRETNARPLVSREIGTDDRTGSKKLSPNFWQNSLDPFAERWTKTGVKFAKGSAFRHMRFATGNAAMLVSRECLSIEVCGKNRTIGPVPVTNEIAGSQFPAACFRDLICDPFCGWMRCDAKPQNMSPTVAARPSHVSAASRCCIAPFAGAARHALDKLGVEWEPTEAERTCNEGRSTQVPVNPVVRVKGRFSRHLRYGKSELVLER